MFTTRKCQMLPAPSDWPLLELVLPFWLWHTHKGLKQLQMEESWACEWGGECQAFRTRNKTLKSGFTRSECERELARFLVGRMASHLNHVFSRRHWRAVKESIIILMPLSEAEPFWQIWEILQVALKRYGVTVQASSFITCRKEQRSEQILGCAVIREKCWRWRRYRRVLTKVQSRSGKSLSSARM